jgi:ankyrin repeat protein
MAASGVKRKAVEGVTLTSAEPPAKKSRTVHTAAASTGNSTVCSAPAVSWCGTGQVVFFTGFHSAALEEAVRSAGGRVAKSFVRDLTLLVTGGANTSSTNSKIAAARTKGISVITASEFANAAGIGSEQVALSMPTAATGVSDACKGSHARPELFFAGFRNARLEAAAQLAGITVSKTFTPAVTMVVVKHDHVRTSEVAEAIDRGIPVVQAELLKEALRSGIIWASSYGQSTIVSLMLAAGTDVDTTDRYGYTALMLAAIRGNDSVVSILLGAGANIAAVSNEGATALMLAAQYGRGSITATLIAKGASFEATCNDGITALMKASSGGHATVVSMLLAAGADIEHTTTSGWSALLGASSDGHEAVVSILLAAGADPEVVSKQYGTALIQAATYGHARVVYMLLAVGANTEAVDHHGRTALIRAASAGKVATVCLLLKAGAHLEATDNNGRTALERTASDRCVSTVSILLAGGAAKFEA